jgi:hypothetical protein
MQNCALLGHAKHIDQRGNELENSLDDMLDQAFMISETTMFQCPHQHGIGIQRSATTTNSSGCLVMTEEGTPITQQGCGCRDGRKRYDDCFCTIVRVKQCQPAVADAIVADAANNGNASPPPFAEETTEVQTS